MSKIKIVNLANYLLPAAVLWLGFVLVCLIIFISKPGGDTHLATGINQQINYQGRLLNSAGAVVPDGNYNIEFKIYQDGDGVIGGGDETLEWTESRTGGNKVLVKNGYFSVYLGAITPFGSSVDWNQDTLWLSVNIGSTGAPSWDGEMSPFTRFSSTPYALNSKMLNGLESSNFVQLAQGTQTDASTTNASISINKTGGTANILDLMRASTSVLTIANNGSTIFKNSSDSTGAFEIQNLSGSQLFGVDTTNNLVTIAGGNNPALRAWSSTTGPGVDKSEGGFVAANGYVYAVGSAGGGTPSNGVYYSKIKADGTLGTWASTSSLNTARWGNPTVVGNGYIYTVGGNDGASSDSVEYAKINADGTLGTWATTSSLGTARYRHNAIAVNGYIYAVGGPSLNSVEYAKINADGTLGTWATTSSLLGVRYGEAVISANGYVYAIGGNSGSGDLATTEYAAINSNGTLGTWNSNTSMGTAQNIVNAVVANGYVYTVGGCGGAGCPSTQVQYASIGNNGTLGTWGTTSSLGTGRYGNGAVVANGYIYAISGTGTTTVEYTSIERVRIGAALDLVGLSGGNLTDGQTGVGGELTAGNTNIIGGLQVQGQANFAQGLSTGSDITVGGSTISGASDLTIRSGGVTALNLYGEGGVYLDASGLGQVYIGTQGSIQDVTVGNQNTSSATRLWSGTSGVTVQSGANTNTALQIKNFGGTTLFGIDTNNSRIFSDIADGGSAVGFKLNTNNSYATSGAKLLSINNNNVEKFSVDKDGNLSINGTAGLSSSCSSGEFLRGQVATGGLTTAGTCAAVTGTEITDGTVANGDLANSSIILALGTSGSDINWGASSVSLGGTATLNLPDAGASVRGLVTTGGQTFAGIKTFSSAIAANGGITFDNASDTLGAHTLAGNIDASNNLVLNIGNAGTDFTAGGGLTLAGALTANGGLSVLPSAAGSVGATITARASQTADLLKIVNESGIDLVTVNPNVGFTIRSSSGFTSTSAFSVVRYNGTDTIIVGVNTTTPGLYTASTTFDLINTNATTLNFGGAATTLNIGPGNGSATSVNIAGGTAATGCTVTGATGDLSCSGALTTATNLNFSNASSTINLTATDNTGELSIEDASNNTLFSIKDLSTNFGAYAETGAFISRNSFYGEEFQGDKTDITAARAAGITTNGASSWGDAFYWSTFEVATTADCTYSVVDDAINGIGRIQNNDASAGCTAFTGSPASTTAPHAIFDADNLPVMLMKVRPSNVGANDDLWVGMGFQGGNTVANNLTPPNEGIYFSNNDGTTWTGTTRNASTSTNVACTGQTVSTTQYALLKIEVVSTTSVRFYVDADVSDGIQWVSCGTSTTNIPTATLAGFMKFGSTTNTRNLDIDFFRIWQDDNIQSDDGLLATETSLEDSPLEILSEGDSLEGIDSRSILADLSSCESDQCNRVDIDAGRLYAGTEIITPKITTDNVSLNSINSTDNKPIEVNGDLNISGTLTADNIRANQIEGLEIMTNSIVAANSSSSSGADSTAQNTSVLDIRSVNFGSVSVSLNLDVEGAIVANGGLSVAGLATFNGESVFNRLARFVDNVIFSKDVAFQGRTSFNNDTGGFAVIESGQTEVRVKFTKPYENNPIVNVGVKNGQFASYAYKDLDKEGFTIVTREPVTSNIEFSWTAFDVKDVRTVTKNLEGVLVENAP